MSRIIVFFRYWLVAALLTIPCYRSVAQLSLNMDEAVAVASTNHPIARNAALAEQKDALLQKQAVEITPVQAKYWQINASEGNDHLWSVTQNFGSIPEHVRRSKHYRLTATAAGAERALTLDRLVWQVKAAYLELVYYGERLEIMREHDRYFEALIGTAEIYLDDPDIAELTKVSAGTRYAAYQSRMYIAEEEVKRAENKLRQLLYTDEPIGIRQTKSELYQIHPDRDPAERFNPVEHKAADEAQSEVAKSAVALEKSKLFPAVHAGYINQHISGAGNSGGWMAGLSFPLWMQPQRARIKQAEIDRQITANETEYERFAEGQHIETLKSLLNEYFVQISFGKENLLKEADLVLSETEKEFAESRITDYAEAFEKVHRAVSAKLDHLEYINMYNQTALELEYYTR